MTLLIIQHSETCSIGLLGDVLRLHGQRTRTVRVDRGEPLPNDLDDLHGIVSLGGPQSANDNALWVEQELHLLRAAHAAGVPILGLCLGAQMLARALGGQVARMNTPELGWVEVRNASVDKEDPLLAGLPWAQTVFAWHNEHVTALPDGATLLQKNAACPVQAFRVGAWSYGFQYHPEWDRDRVLHEIATATAEELAAAGTTANALREATALHAATAARNADRIFTLCTSVLMPGSQLQQGLAARHQLHH